MNQEGMDDRYYFSDWGECICGDDGPGSNPDCGLSDNHEEEEDDE